MEEVWVSSMKSYIAILGRSVWALLNTYYAVVRSKAYCPDSIHVFAEEPYEKDLGKVEDGLRIISVGFGLDPIIQQDTVSEADFFEAGHKVSSLVKSLKDSGSEVAIDTTSGRKTVHACTYASEKKSGCESEYIGIEGNGLCFRPNLWYFILPILM